MSDIRRDLVVRSLDALYDGETGFAVELLEIALTDQPVSGDSRCACGLWPGQRWQCRCREEALERAA